MKTAYVSGPIAGRPRLNRRAFYTAQHMLLNGGWDRALVPHDVAPWSHEGDCPGGYRSSPDAPHAAACNLRTDLIEMLATADTVFMLPGWELSVGARLELQVAAACGLEIHFLHQDVLDDWLSINPVLAKQFPEDDSE